MGRWPGHTLWSPYLFCYSECPTDCLDNQYDATLYYTSFSDSYIEQIANRYGEDEHYWRKNLVRLVIYYPHLTQEVGKT